jgi:cell division protein FtsX
MVDALVIFIVGVGTSVLALSVICAFLSQSLKNRYERNCQLKIYFDWVMKKGTEEQKKLAEELKHNQKLEELKELVGDGFLVKS